MSWWAGEGNDDMVGKIILYKTIDIDTMSYFL